MPRDDYDLAPEPAAAPKKQTTVSRSVAAAGEAAQAAPPVTAASAGAFVRGPHLVVKDGASLPDRCIQCNAPAPDGRVTKRFAYNLDNERPGAVRLIPFVRIVVWIVWLIGRMSSRQYVTVSYCVCKKHRSTRTAAIVGMALGMIIGVTMFLIGIRNSNTGPRGAGIDTTSIIIGVVFFFAGALCGLAIPSLQVAVPLHNGAELKGAGKPFLESMPKFAKTFAPRVR